MKTKSTTRSSHSIYLKALYISFRAALQIDLVLATRTWKLIEERLDEEMALRAFEPDIQVEALNQIRERVMNTGLVGLLGELAEHIEHKSPKRLPKLDESGLLDIKQVSAILGRSQSSIRRDIKAGRFIAPMRVGLRASKWRAADVSTYIGSLIQADLP